MSDEEYSESFVAGLEWIWGEGFMSPGGADEVLEILQGVDLTGKRVLDIGCGLSSALYHRRLNIDTDHFRSPEIACHQ